MVLLEKKKECNLNRFLAAIGSNYCRKFTIAGKFLASKFPLVFEFWKLQLPQVQIGS
jgi:hypothetical protein